MHMANKLELLEHEVAKLTAAELAQFRDWFTRFDAIEWDRQIDRDAAAGKLDALVDQAFAAHRAGKTTPL
jgi:hypothetical protein